MKTKIPKATYSQYRFGSVQGRWYITVGDYHISEIGFETKQDAVEWFNQNKVKLFSENE
jgi:hypothetical protein